MVASTKQAQHREMVFWKLVMQSPWFAARPSRGFRQCVVQTLDVGLCAYLVLPDPICESNTAVVTGMILLLPAPGDDSLKPDRSVSALQPNVNHLPAEQGVFGAEARSER